MVPNHGPIEEFLGFHWVSTVLSNIFALYCLYFSLMNSTSTVFIYVQFKQLNSSGHVTFEFNDLSQTAAIIFVSLTYSVLGVYR